ncbi:hypothetical protein CPB85DRAFT_1332643, partial [Mucidula mucida]
SSWLLLQALRQSSAARRDVTLTDATDPVASWSNKSLSGVATTMRTWFDAPLYPSSACQSSKDQGCNKRSKLLL